MPKKPLLVKKIKINENKDTEISTIRAKLEDPKYIDIAVNRLAVIITEQILNLGGIQIV